ncbi:hypothetical protein BE08_14000 [Sorangium cellulosum]|uniref:Uncharacterized protein n=1 Tax=Sorangium cellulosum TaxID=56 RepID=A0A150P2U5_SORCE|nr:hypothetical protein BE08_14000 [Sorangium cellulosum]
MATFDAYGAATGDRWTTTTFGQASLSGSVEFTLECKGKSASSAGHHLKIDHIELVPVDGGGSSGGGGGGGPEDHCDGRVTLAAAAQAPADAESATELASSSMAMNAAWHAHKNSVPGGRIMDVRK